VSKFSIKLISDVTDQVFFLAIFAAGLFLITILKQTHNPALSSFAAIFLLVAYAVSSSRLPIFKLSDEKIGDNSYYLGFLFTLISLSNALYLFTDSLDQNQIVSDFGIALASTITGILLRIIFNQMKVEPDQIEDKVKETLTEAGIRLSGELENVISEAGNVSSALSNLMKGSMEEMEGVITKSKLKHQELASSIELATENIIVRNKEVVRSIESVTDSIIQRNKEVADQIQGPIAKLGQEIASSTEFASANIIARNKEIASSIESVTESITQGNREVADQIKGAVANLRSENIDQLKAPLDDIKSSLTSLSNHLRDTQSLSLTKSLDGFANALDKNSLKVNQITDTLDAAIEAHKVRKGDLIWNLLTSRFRNKDE